MLAREMCIIMAGATMTSIIKERGCWIPWEMCSTTILVVRCHQGFCTTFRHRIIGTGDVISYFNNQHKETGMHFLNSIFNMPNCLCGISRHHQCKWHIIIQDRWAHVVNGSICPSRWHDQGSLGIRNAINKLAADWPQLFWGKDFRIKPIIFWWMWRTQMT